MMYIKNSIELDFSSTSQIRHAVCIERSFILLYFESSEFYLLDVLDYKSISSGKLPMNIIDIRHLWDTSLAFFTKDGEFFIIDVLRDYSIPTYNLFLPTAFANSMISNSKNDLGRIVLGSTKIYGDKNQNLFIFERVTGVGSAIKNILSLFIPSVSDEAINFIIQEHKNILQATLFKNSKKFALWDQDIFKNQSKDTKKKSNLKPSLNIVNYEENKLVNKAFEVKNYNYEENTESTVVGLSDLSNSNDLILVDNCSTNPKILFFNLDTCMITNEVLFPFNSFGSCITDMIHLKDLPNNKKMLFFESESESTRIEIYTFGKKTFLASSSFTMKKNDHSLWAYEKNGEMLLEIPNYHVIDEVPYNQSRLSITNHIKMRKKMISLSFLLKLLGTYHIYIIKMCYDMLP